MANLTGGQTINASVAKIWQLLMDTDTLARITPCVTQLIKLDEENYTAIVEVRIGPVHGKFTGTLKMTNAKELEGFTLELQQNSQIGNANAVVNMALNPLSDTQMAISFVGDVKLSGTLNTMGMRVITPISNMLSKQFFNNLEKEAAIVNLPQNTEE